MKIAIVLIVLMAYSAIAQQDAIDRQALVRRHTVTNI
jgi:hypothetical protein